MTNIFASLFSSNRTHSTVSTQPKRPFFESGSSASQGRKYVGDWILGKNIGIGSSGRVRLATHKNNPDLKCVVKCIRRPQIKKSSSNTTVTLQHEDNNSERGSTPGLPDFDANGELTKQELYIINEAAINLMLDHPNIVKLYDMHCGEYHCYMFFEYLAGEDLIDYITRQKSKRLNEKRARHIFRKVMSAIEYAHRNHVVHRDLKLENIRYDEKTDQVKVMDFGFASFYSEDGWLQANCGSPCYASPEIYDNREYRGPEIDVWSLGVSLYGMVTGNLPFDGQNYYELKHQIKRAKLHFGDYLSEDVKDLLRSMIHPDPALRCSIQDVLRHPWLNRGYRKLPVDYVDDPVRSIKPKVSASFAESITKAAPIEAGEQLVQLISECIGERTDEIIRMGFKDGQSRRRPWFLRLFGANKASDTSSSAATATATATSSAINNDNINTNTSSSTGARSTQIEIQRGRETSNGNQTIVIEEDISNIQGVKENTHPQPKSDSTTPVQVTMPQPTYQPPTPMKSKLNSQDSAKTFNSPKRRSSWFGRMFEMRANSNGQVNGRA